MRLARDLRWWALPMCFAGLVSCTGSIDLPGAGSSREGAPGTPPGSGGSGPGGGPRKPAVDQSGAMGLRRLTRREYQNTLRDLGLVTDAAAIGRSIPPDGRDGTPFEAAGIVSLTEIDRFLTASEQVGQAVLAKLPGLLGCDPAAIGEEPCVRQLVTGFGRRAYRRPLAAPEVDALVAYYRQSRADLSYGFDDAVRVLIQVMLQSPNFLYHGERGLEPAVREGALIRLDPHELASRLSYYVWSSMPDAQLFRAADGGGLQTPADIAAETKRMLADPKARSAVDAFYEPWLNLPLVGTLGKDTKLFPTFTPEVATAMQAETRAFVASIFDPQGSDGGLASLLSAPYTFVNEPLAKIYGVKGVTGTAMRRVALDPAQRAGLLTQGGLLALESLPGATSPVQRGKMILKQILCAPPPAPPASVNATPPAVDRTLSRRAQYEQHSTIEPCRSCHQRMDSIGFLFESYDPIGRFRQTEYGRPIDTRVTITGLDGEDRVMSDARELVGYLATSPQVRECAVRQWLRFALHRMEAPEEEGSVSQALDEFAASGWDLRALVAALPNTKAFRYRLPTAEEVSK